MQLSCLTVPVGGTFCHATIMFNSSAVGFLLTLSQLCFLNFYHIQFIAFVITALLETCFSGFWNLIHCGYFWFRHQQAALSKKKRGIFTVGGRESLCSQTSLGFTFTCKVLSDRQAHQIGTGWMRLSVRLIAATSWFHGKKGFGGAFSALIGSGLSWIVSHNHSFSRFVVCVFVWCFLQNLTFIEDLLYFHCARSYAVLCPGSCTGILVFAQGHIEFLVALGSSTRREFWRLLVALGAGWKAQNSYLAKIVSSDSKTHPEKTR